MMKRSKPYLKRGDRYSHTAKSAVDGILGLLQFDPELYAAFELWDREARPYVRGCEAVAIQGTKLCVRVPSAAHRQELLSYKDRLLKKINQGLGRRKITDVQFEFDSVLK